MTLHTLIIFILSFIGTVLFGTLILVVFLIGRSTVKNNPEKAYIFVKDGLNVERAIKAKICEISKKGVSYKYGNKIVIVPRQYHEAYYRNRRMIFISKIGQMIASPFDNDMPLEKEESLNLIYELTSSHIGADAMRAMKGNKKTSVLLIAIIAFIIGAIVIFGYYQFKDNQQQKQVQQSVPTKQVPIEVK